MQRLPSEVFDTKCTPVQRSDVDNFQDFQSGLQRTNRRKSMSYALYIDLLKECLKLESELTG